MAYSCSNPSLARRRGFRKKAAADEHLKQQRVDNHLHCNVCTKIPYPGTDSLIPLIAEQDDGMGPDFDAGIYAYIYQMNAPSEVRSIRIDEETSTKIKDRCARHVQRLQKELVKSRIIQSEESRFTGDKERDRTIAPFDYEEIEIGSLLGTGGFSSVYEVASFHPARDLTDSVSVHEQNGRQYLADNVLGPIQAGDEIYPTGKKSKIQGHRMSRYALKHLRKGLMKEPERFERAAIDLVLEAQLLMAMNHPNIITLRGWSMDGVNGFASGKHTGFFMIIDRLPETLENRVFEWRNSIRKHRGRLKMPWSKQKAIVKLDSILLERLQVAYDISSAMEYMHERRIIYRDLKTTNIGFDVHGDLKLFDFGLTRLLPSNKDQETYLMSRVGTKYYMAPEVRKKVPYNLSADVYSFGVCMWELMSLGSPREVLRKFKDDSVLSVPTEQCPLPICKCWPDEVCQIVRGCITIGPIHRPKASNVRTSLQKLLERLGHKQQIKAADRAEHLGPEMTATEYSTQATSDYFPGSQSEDSKLEITSSFQDVDTRLDELGALEELEEWPDSLLTEGEKLVASGTPEEDETSPTSISSSTLPQITTTTCTNPDTVNIPAGGKVKSSLETDDIDTLSRNVGANEAPQAPD